MSNNPFVKAIADAEEREVMQSRHREEQRLAAAHALEKIRQQQAAARHQEELRDFGHRFLSAVVKKVLKTDWKPEYIKLVQRYSEGLLRKEDQTLPVLNEHHQEKILEIFSYGLTLADEHGVEIPERFFYGQRLLAERQAEMSKLERLNIKPGPRPKSVSTTTDKKPANVVQLPSAITAKGSTKRRKQNAS